MKPWHLRDPEGFARERAETEAAYPELHFSTYRDRIELSGTLPIVYSDSVLDRFAVSITLLDNYPGSLPVVREVGGRIPRTLARHMLQSGEACVLLPEDRWRSWPKGSSLLSYISGPLRNYLIGQALVERGEPWPFGEWRHGLEGMRDYYREVFGTDGIRKARKYLEYLTAKKVKGHWDCPCGSGRPLRHCHVKLVADLREKMPRSEARSAIEHLDYVLRVHHTSNEPQFTPD
jgi:hypothetical protein